jgi:hypothetical protein
MNVIEALMMRWNLRRGTLILRTRQNSQNLPFQIQADDLNAEAFFENVYSFRFISSLMASSSFRAPSISPWARRAMPRLKKAAA